METTFPLGTVVRDKVSGFVGTVVQRTENLYGPWRFEVRAESVENAPPKSEWFYGSELASV